MGLLSFAAVAQILPAFLGGLFWRRGTARGAIAGMTIGSLAWFYLLLLPSLRRRRCRIFWPWPLASPGCGPRRWSRSRPPLVGGVVLSLAANLLPSVAFS